MQTGGAGRDRTGDLLNANQALSQLSYSPLSDHQQRKVASTQKMIEADWMQGTSCERRLLDRLATLLNHHYFEKEFRTNCRTGKTIALYM